MSPQETGAILAPLYMSIHKTPPPPVVLPLHDWMGGTLRLAGDTVPKHIPAGVLNLIDAPGLPADGLCHCNLNAGNVIMTAQGPRITDWTNAVRAPTALDLGCGHVILSELAPERVNDPERPRAVNAALQSEFARLAGMSSATLTAAMEPYLSIARLFLLLPRTGAQPGPAGAVDPERRSEPSRGGPIVR